MAGTPLTVRGEQARRIGERPVANWRRPDRGQDLSRRLASVEILMHRAWSAGRGQGALEQADQSNCASPPSSSPSPPAGFAVPSR